MARVSVSPQADQPKQRPEGAILAIFTAIAFAAVGFLLYTLEQDSIDDPAQKAARGEVTVDSTESLVRPEHFRRALRAVMDESPNGSVVWSLRMEPARIDAQVRQPDNKRQIFHVNPAFEVTKDDFGRGANFGAPPEAVDANAPARILAAAAERYGFKRANFDYMVLNLNAALPPSWTAFFKQDEPDNYVIADEHGRDVRRPGEPSKETREMLDDLDRRQKRILRDAARKNKCLVEAHSLPEVEACSR